MTDTAETVFITSANCATAALRAVAASTMDEASNMTDTVTASNATVRTTGGADRRRNSVSARVMGPCTSRW